MSTQDTNLVILKYIKANWLIGSHQNKFDVLIQSDINNKITYVVHSCFFFLKANDFTAVDFQ